jgi:hypothetical protein
MLKRMFTKLDAVLSLDPTIQAAEDNGTLIWVNPTTPTFTDAQILQEIVRLNAEWEATEYQRLRAKEYPSIQDQLDMQYHDSLNGTTTWQDAVDAVKIKYPKP